MKRQYGYDLTIKGTSGDEVAISIAGRMALENMEALLREICTILQEKKPSKLIVDLGGVTYLDSAGALILMNLEHETKLKEISFSLINMGDNLKGIWDLLPREISALTSPLHEKSYPGLFARIGEISVREFNDLIQLLTFVGELLRAMVYVFFHPGSLRWGDVLVYIERVGVDGLPIVGLINFLLGLIMAFMTSLQLKPFGANIYVASLVTIAMVKELGPIMTAIIVAGRSGSAFSAEIGTMMVNEEVDALIVMGFDPTRFLAVPKAFAAMIAVPILTIFADLFAMLGGLMVGVFGLNLSVYSYVQETLRNLTTFDMISSMIKSMVFATLIAGIGCQRGFQVRGGAEAVGIATTSAVVSALFLIIVADSVFAIVLHYIS